MIQKKDSFRSLGAQVSVNTQAHIIVFYSSERKRIPELKMQIEAHLLYKWSLKPWQAAVDGGLKE